MLKKRTLISLLVLVMGLFLVACSSNESGSQGGESNTSNDQEKESQPTAIRIGTSSSGSPFYTIAIGMSNILSKNEESLNATVEPVGGSNPNIFAIDKDKVDFAIANGLAALNGFEGNPPFENEVDVRLVAQGQPSVRQLIVRKDSGIESISDLVGKKIIAKRPPLPEIEMIAVAALKAYGISEDDVELLSTTDTPEALEALRIGSVDGVILPASLHAANLTELFTEDEFRFISFDEDKLDEIESHLPKAVRQFVIPAGTYPGQDEDVNAFRLNTYLVAQGDLSDDVVYKFLKTIFDNYDQFEAVHSSAKDWTIENTLTAPAIPFHPGAIKYFKEIGEWNSDLDELQKSLETK